MSRAERPVLLVGGLPGESAEDAMRAVAPVLGDLLVALPDGEPGDRRMWVGAIATRIWSKHPALELVKTPRGAAGLPDGVPADYDDFWIYRTRPGTTAVEVESIGYPADARASYAVFRRLRDEGIIAPGTRFQFGFPFPEDPCREFTDNAKDLALIQAGYMHALKHDIRAICEQIPHQDLLVQWEVNWETLAVEHGDFIEGQPPLDYEVPGDPLDRFRGYMAELSALVPEGVKLGMHLCYGDLHHRHFTDPPDLSTCAKMANAARESAGRRLDYVHMPVPRDRNDDAFFAPLDGLDMGDTVLYIGLVHYTDGAAGSRDRLAACRRHYAGPLGVATECGMGRRPADQSLADLLEIHRELAAGL